MNGTILLWENWHPRWYNTFVQNLGVDSQDKVNIKVSQQEGATPFYGDIGKKTVRQMKIQFEF